MEEASLRSSPVTLKSQSSRKHTDGPGLLVLRDEGGEGHAGGSFSLSSAPQQPTEEEQRREILSLQTSTLASFMEALAGGASFFFLK